MRPFYFGRNMNFWTLFVGNIIVSFGLSFILVKYGNQYKNFYSYFTDAPENIHKEKITLNPTVKFEIEYTLSFFLVPGDGDFPRN